MTALAAFCQKKRELVKIVLLANKEELDTRLAAGEIDQPTYDAVLDSLNYTEAASLRQIDRAEQSATADLMKAQIAQESNVQQTIYENENEIYWKRLDALSKFCAEKRKIIEIDYQAEINRLNALREVGAIDQATYDTEIAAATSRKNARIDSSNQEETQAGHAILRSFTDNLFETGTKSSVQQAAEEQNVEQLALAEQYKQGLIKKTEYEKQKAAITDKYTRQAFEKEISLLKGQLQYFTHSAEDREKLTEKLAETEIAYNKYQNEQMLADAIATGENSQRKNKKSTS